MKNIFKRTKKFKLRADQIKQLIKPMGGCLATNMITIDGKPVNFMYRENPINPQDSGWRFFSGYEDDDYINNNKNTQVYAVNTIANYDKDIIPFLDADYLTAFEKDPDTNKFVLVENFKLND